MTPSDFSRLEDKVDILTDAVTKLVLFEERQTVQALAINNLTIRTDAVERKLDMWINRGVGAWALLASVLAIFKISSPYL